MLTPAQLGYALNARGYAVTNRQLRDWRTKGLLPSLTDYGQGRGMGILRKWNNPTILEQAITVYELLAIRRRADFALLGLWYCGYEVDIAAARKAWLAMLRRTQISYLGNAVTTEGKEDALGDLANRLSRRISLEIGQERESLEFLLIGFLNAFLNPSSAIEVDEEFVSIARSFFKLIGSSFADIESADMQRLIDYVRDRISIDSMQSLITSSTNEELRVAQSRWCRATFAIGRMCLLNFDKRQEEMLLLGKRLKLTFGSLFIFAMLLASKEGFGSQIDEYIETLETWKVQIN